MATRPSRKPKLIATSPEDAAARFAVMDKAISAGGVQIDELESALGMYLLGFHFGWKVLYLIHSKRTIKKYEALLNIKITEVFPEFGPQADRTNAFTIIQTVSNFWKLVSGDEKPSIDLDKRALNE